jgi:hypothetical protein
MATLDPQVSRDYLGNPDLLGILELSELQDHLDLQEAKGSLDHWASQVLLDLLAKEV